MIAIGPPIACPPGYYLLLEELVGPNMEDVCVPYLAEPLPKHLHQVQQTHSFGHFFYSVEHQDRPTDLEPLQSPLDEVDTIRLSKLGKISSFETHPLNQRIRKCLFSFWLEFGYTSLEAGGTHCH